MQFFYDAQIKRFLTQFMRLMSNFCYQDAKGQLVRVPVRYGDMNRQVASIVNKNSENIVQSAPFIACYIKDLKFDRSRVQDPTFVSKMSIRERAYDSENQEYLNYQGANYTVERIMPTPYNVTFNADIWTTSMDQKLQLWEQITVLFNPSMEIQSNDNYIDWTSLSVLELTDGCVFESRTVPQGISNDLSIATLQFTAPIWISPPAKIKKLGIVTKIINNIFAAPPGSVDSGEFDAAAFGGDIFREMPVDARVTVTPLNYDLLVLNNTAVLVPEGAQNVSEGWVDVNEVPYRPSWLNLLDLYPGKFTAGLSQLRLKKPDGNEIVATLRLHPDNECLMTLTVDPDTAPANTIITASGISRGTIDAIINPRTFNPHSVQGQGVDKRYLILEDINVSSVNGWIPLDGADAWKGASGDFYAHANDIIQWDGNNWNVIFNSSSITDVTYITNTYTGIQYKWDGESWVKSFEGVYDKADWRLVL